jgi:hypothetical protein
LVFIPALRKEISEKRQKRNSATPVQKDAHFHGLDAQRDETFVCLVAVRPGEIIIGHFRAPLPRRSLPPHLLLRPT